MKNHGSRRLAQHRPNRETDAKEKSRLKQENKSLKKQITRLRRQVDKVEDSRLTAQVILEEEQESMALLEGAVPGGGCGECGSHNLVEFPLPSGTLLVCKDCKARKKTS